MIFSADETCDVGKEAGSPVSPDYGPTGNEFSGEVNWVQIDLEKDDHDHLISPEERFRSRWRNSSRRTEQFRARSREGSVQSRL